MEITERQIRRIARQEFDLLTRSNSYSRGGGGGGAIYMYELGDVARDGNKVSGAAENRVLKYGADGKWYGGQVGFGELTGQAAANQLPNIENLTNFSTRVYDATLNRTANTVLAGPTSGNAAPATFRSLVAADIPSLAISKISGLQTALDSKLDIAFFSSLFKAYAGTDEVTPNNSTANVDNIKAMFGFWTKQYISALGQGSGGGGGGGQGDVTWELLKDGNDERPIAMSHLSVDSDGYTSVMSILTGYTTSGRNYKVQKDADNHLFVNVPWTDNDHHAWSDITDKPATATRWPAWSEVTSKPTEFDPPASVSYRRYNFNPSTAAGGKWHRLGNYKTMGDATNFVVEVYDGAGYNGQGRQNSVTKITIKDGWQETRAAANSVGAIIECSGYPFATEISIVATSDTEGALWIYLPSQYVSGSYSVYGSYDTWTHNSGNSDDTTTRPVTNQTLTGNEASYLYYDLTYNSSVSKSGQTLTVKINGTEQSLENTWRGIQNNLTSDSTNESLSAAQGKALANGSARDNTKLALTGGEITGNLNVTGTLKMASKLVATQEWVGDNYISISFFETLFNALNSSGNKVNANTTSGIASIKAMFGFWTEQYISALGQGSGGGGGGQGDVTWTLLEDNNDTRQIASSHLTGLCGGTFTGKNYAVLADTTNNKLYVNVPWENTTYSQGTGISIANNTISNTGVRSTTLNGNYLRVNTNGTNTDLTIPYATNAGTALVGNKLNVMATISGQDTTNYPWRLLAQSAEITTNYVDTEAIIVLRQYAVGGRTGIIKIAFRTNEIATTASGVSAVWLDRFGFAVDDVKIAVYWVANKSYADVFVKATAWNRMEMHVIANRSWSFVNSSEGVGGANPENAYASIEAAATAIHGRAYTNIVSAQDGGIVSYANSAGAATNDSDGNTINSTYLKLAGGTMANTNLVTNLNADLLDGTHKSDLFTVFTNILSGDDANKTSITIGGTNKKLTINYATNANSAAKLTTISKTLFGNTYWTNEGVPTSIGTSSSPAALSYVTNIDSLLYFDRTNNRIGVGANSPSYKLHVAGTGYFTDTLTIANNKGIYMLNTSSSGCNVLDLSNSNELHLGYGSAASGYDTIINGNNVYLRYGTSRSNGMILNSSGNVGIGTTSPSYKLHVSGDIYATGGVTSLSDIRKKNVTSMVLPLSLAEIANAPTIKFTWKDEHDTDVHVGTVAQYWASVLPEVVKHRDGVMSMQYDVTALACAIVDAREIVALKCEVSELKKELMKLKKE